MKTVVPHLRVGETVCAKIVEVSRDGSMIVSFYGDLIRVRNQTHQNFTVGKKVDLIVDQVNPLKFQMKTAPKKDRLSINRRV